MAQIEANVIAYSYNVRKYYLECAMILDEIVDYLSCNGVSFEQNYSTSKLSFLEIGGPARLVAFPKSKYELCKLLNKLTHKAIKFMVIGNCSNVFFSSFGYDGVVISTRLLNEIHISGNSIEALCGALVTDCAVLSMSFGLSDLEFLCGIPGSVGGAVYMNSCAYDGKISSVVAECEAYDILENKIINLTNEELCFSDKKSIFSGDPNLIILSVKFKLKNENINLIKKRMLEISLKRIKSQPLELGNCGSTFKRPLNLYASKIIDDLNLKGLSIGGAMVSKKHAGFIVNFNTASSKDVVELIEKIREEALDKLGVLLEQEIIFVE